MPKVLEELSDTRARIRTSRRLVSRSGGLRVCAEHELSGDNGPGSTMSPVENRHCYVCRRPAPASREKVRAERWCDIRMGEITIAVVCFDCSPKPPTQTLDRLEFPSDGRVGLDRRTEKAHLFWHLRTCKEERKPAR